MIRRLDKKTFNRTFEINRNNTITPFAERFTGVPHQSSPGGILRPTEPAEPTQVEGALKGKDPDGVADGYSVVHISTFSSAVQQCITEHGQTHPACSGRLVTAYNLITKWGVSAIVRLKCDSCDFVSQKNKLFREITTPGRGRNPAEPNRSLAVGLNCTSIGNAGAQRLFAAMAINTPTQSSLQKQLNTVGDKITVLNNMDMEAHRTKLKDVLEYGGYCRDTPIPAECDRQYNNSLRNSRGKTPYAPATQSRDVLAENLTPEKKIIAFNHENKLCKAGAAARAKGSNVSCPGHTGCTATIGFNDNIGDEKRGGRKLAQSLLSGAETITVNKITTDADGRMAEGFSEEMAAEHVTTERFLDVVHKKRSLRRALSKANLKPTIKSTKLLSKERALAYKRLADSLAWRAEGEVKGAPDKLNTVEEITDAVSGAIPAILNCYEGNHTLCKQSSLVCDGVETRYEYLPEYACGAFSFSQSERDSIAAILNKKMGKQALLDTRHHFTTQKAEATNHCFATTNPKHTMTCARNGVHRDNSAIHMLNNPVGDSIFEKTRYCGVAITPNTLCLETLNKMSKRQADDRRRSHTRVYQQRRASLRRRRYESYDKQHCESYYKQNQLEPK